MPAVSGSPTQNRTSVANTTELAGVPCDQFEPGDQAFVELVPFLGTAATYRFRRGAPPSPPDWITIVSVFEQPGRAYWELFEGAAGPTGPDGPVGPLDASIAEMLSQILCELKKLRFYVALMTDGNPGDGSVPPT